MSKFAFEYRPVKQGRASLYAVIVLSLCCTLSGGCNERLMTIDLKPTNFLTGYVTAEGCGDYVWCPGLCIDGTEPSFSPDSADGEVLVGYDNYYDAGTEPFPCTEYVGHYYRAAAYFDLSKFDVTSSAILKLNHRMTQTDPEIGSNADDGPAASVGYATSNWFLTRGANHFANVALPGDGFQPLPQHRPVNADVSYTLHQWLSKTPGVQLPNWGFVVIGHNESFPDNNDTWIGRYDWTLSVDFFASQNPRMKGLGTGATQ